jgi:PAS domain S-box-containing protein
VSLKEAQDLIQIAPAFFGFISPEGVLVTMNDLSLYVIESRREDLVGRLFWEAPWWKPIPESAARIREAVTAAAQGHSSQFDIEYHAVVDGVGQKRWVDLTFTPFRDEENKVVRIAASGVDITERRSAKEELRRSQDQLIRAINVSKIGFYEWDIRQNRMEFSEQMKNDWGVAKDISFEDALDLLHPDDRDRVAELIRSAIEKRENYSTEYRVIRPDDGKTVWIQAQGEITYDEAGLPLRFFGTSLDITERKQTAQTLAETKAAIENEKENFYHLFRQTPEMVCVLMGPDHVFEFVNAAHIKALGFDATGLAVREAQPDSVEVHGILDDVYRTGVTAELREIAVTVTGRLRYFNLTYSARRDLSGAINGVMILGSEVTDLVAARASLESSEKALRGFLNAIPATLWSATAEGEINFLNRFWSNYSGQEPAADLSDVRWLDIVHPDDRAQMLEEWTSAVARQEPIDHRFRLKHAGDGEYRWHRSRGAPLIDDRGRVIRWAGYISDIHDERCALDNLTNEREIRERFVATLTHDLRTPLTAARMSAQILLRRAHEPVALQKTATRILENIDRADAMIRDLLDANRIKAGESLPIEIQHCRLDQIASGVLDDLSTIHGDRFVLRTAVPVEGYWSCDGLRRILENLCLNAVKYGSSVHPITVTISLPTADTARVEVHNEGNPIAPENQANLFLPYRRIESTNATRQKGWGLGLTLVKGLTEAHGGTAALESSAAMGTTFRIDLPIDSRPVVASSQRPDTE